MGDKQVALQLEGSSPLEVGLYRAGALVAGDSAAGEGALLGWYCPTYAHREPALHCLAAAQGPVPLRLITWWQLGGARREDVEIEWESPGEGAAACRRVSYRGEVLRL
jgi:hypothetical protein